MAEFAPYFLFFIRTLFSKLCVFMTKNTFVVGFLLFAIFFGAGNLIFPPKLGYESGAEFFSAISGFILTGVGLPLLGIIVSAFYNGGYKTALDKIHPWFSISFLVIIYLSIGPFFAVPRTAATAYEMAVVPFLSEKNVNTMWIFTAAYFALVLWLTLNPTRMVDRIGAILTPVLLVSIMTLVVKSIFVFSSQSVPEPQTTESGYFFKGLIEGYFTMDALASITFSVVVLNAIRSKKVPPESFKRETILAAIFAAIALSIIYITIAWIGNKMSIPAETLAMLTENKQDLGSYILTTVMAQAFGGPGSLILGTIVCLACLTTAVGLIVSVSAYFHEVWPKLSYKNYVLMFTLISFLIANQGLKEVISASLPVLLIMYPIAMSVIILLLIKAFIPLPITAIRTSLLCVTIISILSVMNIDFVQHLPLKAHSLEWLPFAILGCVVGAVCHPWVSKKP